MNQRILIKDTLHLVAMVAYIQEVEDLEYVGANEIYDHCYKGHNNITLEYLENILLCFGNSSLFKAKQYEDGTIRYRFMNGQW